MIPEEDEVIRQLLSHRGMLMGYIVSIVRDATVAEDVFQNTALVVWKKAHTLKNTARFPAWARKVARLEALSALRKSKNVPQALDESVLELLEDHWQAEDSFSSMPATDALQKCLQRLSPRCRRLVELRYSENVRGQQLADTVGQSLNTVYVALSRVHRHLAACVKHRLAQEGV